MVQNDNKLEMLGPETLAHQAVVRNDSAALEILLQRPCSQQSLSFRVRGHTPLTLAISLNRARCVALLLRHGASALAPTATGWSPMDEATSVGDRHVMALVYVQRRLQLKDWFETKGKGFLEELGRDLSDFTVSVQWLFKSIVPFVSGICPSDTYKIFKKGGSFRVDLTLIGFEKLSWLRGNISLIFNHVEKRLVILDHQLKLIQQIYPHDFSLPSDVFDEEISIALNSPIKAIRTINWPSLRVTRATTGFLWTGDKSEKISGLDTSVWNVESVDVTSRIRTEHLTAEPLPPQKIKEMQDEERIVKERETRLHQEKKGKLTSSFQIANPDTDISLNDLSIDDAAFDNYKPGYRNIDPSERDFQDFAASQQIFDSSTAFRPSLNPPPISEISFLEFFSSDEYLHLGRPLIKQERKESYSATIWMHDNPVNPFPVKLASIIPILELLGQTSSEIRCLREFFTLRLPPGFPLQVEIPFGLLPLSAVIKFVDVGKCEDETLFDIPKYRPGEVVGAGIGHC